MTRKVSCSRGRFATKPFLWVEGKVWGDERVEGTTQVLCKKGTRKGRKAIKGLNVLHAMSSSIFGRKKGKVASKDTKSRRDNKKRNRKGRDKRLSECIRHEEEEEHANLWFLMRENPLMVWPIDATWEREWNRGAKVYLSGCFCLCCSLSFSLCFQSLGEEEVCFSWDFFRSSKMCSLLSLLLDSYLVIANTLFCHVIQTLRWWRRECCQLRDYYSSLHLLFPL